MLAAGRQCDFWCRQPSGRPGGPIWRGRVCRCASGHGDGRRSAGAESLRKRIESLDITHSEGDHITISVGYASTIPSRSASPTDLIKAADQALYQAKQEGRNRAKQAGILTLVPHSDDE